ncbi:secreted RxLR effector protein 161-like [Daphnia magna]|uniref:secreted RxLR effector protein 161-like n=1 Tax=Daphnia magna TaxID=35525 RepID=UPI001E1BDB47|nr:secreted RxLR effector protein 161-like [Daphnia magna]
MTRPDICYAVGQVSKYCQNPDPSHWDAVVQIFAYLKGTADYGIWLGGNRSGLVGFTDADYAGDKNDYRSTSGGIFFFNGGPVSWFSKKQSCTVLSTTESEYIAACEATKTIVWLSCLLEDFTGVEQQKIPLYCDNQEAVRLTYNAEFHQRTKHVLTRYHYIRQKVSEGKIEVKYIPTNDQLADILTKALPSPKFTMMREKIGVGKSPN